MPEFLVFYLTMIDGDDLISKYLEKPSYKFLIHFIRHFLSTLNMSGCFL